MDRARHGRAGRVVSHRHRAALHGREVVRRNRRSNALAGGHREDVRSSRQAGAETNHVASRVARAQRCRELSNRFEHMDCERIEEMLPAFVEYELTPKDASLVRAHVESCPRCSEALQAFTVMERSLITRRKEVPPFEAFLPPALAPSRWHPNFFLRSLRALTSVPGMAIVLVMWAGFLIARYSDRL